MKTFLTVIAAAVFGSVLSITLIGQAQPAKAPSAVAVVSGSRVLSESTHGRVEAARLQNLQQQRGTDLRTKQQALETTRQQMSTATDAQTRQDLQQKETQQRAELERLTVQAQQDLQSLQREINTDMARRVKTALDDLMKTQPYQIVLNSDTSVMWMVPEVDLTAAVVGRLNAAQ